uniref:Vacuolar ATPase assembly protein VMA22 n=1 Tax=Attheya septentrionalis TaxID=420275 RepID=A0A7S2XI77_9STRA|mmetsp:Transcript_1148/g.2086  ORF Transcript_1148/g.2086 Transcript_1148/m.2086 type:complete len:221 (+) Transcript_1148:49-711(+)
MGKTKDQSTSSSVAGGRVEALLLLDAYSTAHAGASQQFKSSLWNLSKARRQMGGMHLGTSTNFSASNVREELRAKAILTLLEPKLVQEQDGKDKMIDTDPYILSLDGPPNVESDDKENSNNSHTNEETLSSAGLRQRKGTKESNAAANKWTQEQEKWEEEDEIEEAKLRNVDPAYLFAGLPPPSLKAAQSNAREALAGYIEAANLIVALMETLNTQETKK